MTQKQPATKVLRVSHDRWDNWAFHFDRYLNRIQEDKKEDVNEHIKQLWEKAKKNDNDYVKEIAWRFESDIEELSFKAYEFGQIDPKFIQFVRRNWQTEDDRKHFNTYFIRLNWKDIDITKKKGKRNNIDGFTINEYKK